MGRNRGALLTATFLPFIVLFFAPIQVLIQFRVARDQLPEVTDVPIPGLAGATDPSQILVGFVYPILFVMGGLLLPSVTTAYAIVTERERRSLELLIALPVSVTEILAAKLGTVLVVTAMVGVPYIAVVITLLLILGIANGPAVVALFVSFAAAVTCSTGISLLLTLLARDFRTANNLNGAIFGPLLVITVGVLAAVARPANVYAVSALLLLIAAAAVFIARSWVSFERYLE